MSMDKSAVYPHFHPDEHAFVDRALEWTERAATRHERRLTDFLDPRQREIVAMIANREPDVRTVFYGGYAEAERTRAWIAPDYADPDDADFDIALLAVTSDDPRIGELEHGDYLGALLGLGLKREKIGDLHVHEWGCHALLDGRIAEYVRLQLQTVHRMHVRTERLPLERLDAATHQLDETVVTVASLRLDGVVSEAIRVSRAKVLQPIKAGRCRVNWKTVEDPAALLREGDVVSVQGHGRFKVLQVEGPTRSGRMRVRIGKYV
jgi:RNA-binding protein YlmH